MMASLWACLSGQVATATASRARITIRAKITFCALTYFFRRYEKESFYKTNVNGLVNSYVVNKKLSIRTYTKALAKLRVAFLISWKFRCKVTPCVPSQTDPLVRLKMTPWS